MKSYKYQSSIPRARFSAPKIQACLIIVLALAFAALAQAQTYRILYSFTGGKDGANPQSGTLIFDSQGNIYGTALNGGSYGHGTAFGLTPAGKLVLLHEFSGGEDGAHPDGGLVLYWEVFYGTTEQGGAFNQGTVFKIRQGQESIVHSFAGYPNDGQGSYSDLTLDKSGDLYGVTPYGGSYGAGIIFEIDTSGLETVLQNFNFTDGYVPTWTPFLDLTTGILYGTTVAGGPSGGGAVYEFDPSGAETVLHNFPAYSGDGSSPNGGVITDALGNLYGTTWNGGSYGAGTVFRLAANGAETILHSFTGGTDGGSSMSRLVRDSAGNLYGTTNLGGTSNCGTVYKLNANNGQLTTLHQFSCADGANPTAGLLQDRAGNLYGTAYAGGPYGYGVVFQIAP
jgi:uncharacterized repeat protein (TIGR03803 family)